MTQITRTKEIERKILIELYKFALELSNQDIPQLYELGHYLTDNLISKISMLIGEEEGINYKFINNRGVEQTRGFYWLYNNILKQIYSSAPDYSKIEKLHELRNIYQHSEWSITYHYNKEFARNYIKEAKNIMIATNIIKTGNEIKSSNYLLKKTNKQDRSKGIKSNLLRCHRALKNICSFYFQLQYPDIEYENEVGRTKAFISLKTLEKYRSDCFEQLELYYKEDEPKYKYIGTTSIKIVYEQLEISISIKIERIEHVYMTLGNKYVEHKSEVEPLLAQLLEKISKL